MDTPAPDPAADPTPDPTADRAVTPLMDAPIARQVFVCTAKACAANGSEATLEAFRAQLIEKGLLFYKGNRAGSVSCVHCGSIGFCQIGPAVMVYGPGGGAWYAHVTADRVAEIIEQHVVGGEVVEGLVRKRLGPA